MSNSELSETDESIKSFGEQWTRFTDNLGYYGSAEVLKDIVGPLLNVDEIEHSRTLEIGSGTGRIVNMLLDLGVKHVIAVEPSDAFEVLVKNTKTRSSQVTYRRTMGDSLPMCEVDLIFSISVLHHIPEPEPVVKAAWEALRPSGKLVIWLYGQENNQLYILCVRALRVVSKILPDSLLSFFSNLLNILLSFYILLCRFFRLPLFSSAA